MSIEISNNPAKNPGLPVNQPIGTAESILDNLEELSIRMAGNLGTKLAQPQAKMLDPSKNNINFGNLSSLEDLAEKAKDPDKLGEGLKRRIYPDSKTTATRAATELDLRNDPSDIEKQKAIKERHQSADENASCEHAEQREIDMEIQQKEQDKKRLIAAGLLLNGSSEKEGSGDGGSIVGRQPTTTKKVSSKAYLKQGKLTKQEKPEKSKKEKKKRLSRFFNKIKRVFRNMNDDDQEPSSKDGHNHRDPEDKT